MGASKGTIRKVAVADLTPHPENYRQHPEDQLQRLVASLQRNGQRKAVVVQKSTNRIIAGHGVVEAARLLGWSEVVADVWDCSDEQALAYLVDDNELSRWAEDDSEALNDLLAALSTTDYPALSYDEDDIGGLLGSLGDQEFIGDEPDHETAESLKYRWLFSVILSEEEKKALDAACREKAEPGETLQATARRLLMLSISSRDA